MIKIENTISYIKIILTLKLTDYISIINHKLIIHLIIEIHQISIGHVVHNYIVIYDEDPFSFKSIDFDNNHDSLWEICSLRSSIFINRSISIMFIFFSCKQWIYFVYKY